MLRAVSYTHLDVYKRQDLYARATAACKGDFDKLFVPFRCIASDVYNKKQLIMKEGDL